MKEIDFQLFHDEWVVAHELSSSNKVPSDKAINKSFDLFFEYSIESVIKAMDLHSIQSRFAPTPNDILDLLRTPIKRISADEAWAICPKTEFETVVWTVEMAEAYGVAFNLISDGDLIAARMAFKAAYERICNLAELQNKPVNWSVALGYDKELITPVIEKAVQQGRLSQHKASKYLPAPIDAGPIGKLLTGKVVDISTGKTLENIKKLRQVIADVDKAHKRDQQAEELRKEIKNNKFETNRQRAINYCNKNIDE